MNVVPLDLRSVVDPNSIRGVCLGWLREKAGLSGSKGTENLYGRYLASFRATLQANGLDLDSPASAVRPYAEAWASRGRDENGVSGATYNNRLSILSSFYDFCIRHDIPWAKTNPIKAASMRKVQPYRAARAIEPNEVVRRLQQIDTRTIAGQRDYAIITLALVTGRRVTELRRLRHEDIDVSLDPFKVTVTWRRTKGGKEMRDTLPRTVGKALLAYIGSVRSAYGPDIPEYVWISLAMNGTQGHQLSYNAVSDICSKYLGTSKVHTLRHTFAHTMEQAGAKVSDIQARLGHTNIATTGRYLQSLKSDENPHADELARLFGLN